MKRSLILILTAAIVLVNESATMAQMQGVGIYFGAYDFLGPQTGNDYFFTQQNYVINGVDRAPIGQPEEFGNDTVKKNKLFWNPLVRVTYWWQLSKHFDLNLGLSLADLAYPTSSKDTVLINDYVKNAGQPIDKFLGELDARINYNIIPKENHLFSPYIFAGITAAYHPVYWGADFPVGAGLNVNMSKKHNDVYLNFEAGYKVALTNNDFNHLQYTAGFVYWFKPGYRKPAEEAYMAPPPPPSDMDHDGVPDSVDKCPTVAGLPQFDGCPDTDGDGIPDNLDACPLVAGLAQFNGCPDTDGDGIPDNKDKCPYVAGLPQYDGCPPPDRDHDGVPDDVDKCPDVAGPASNQGCPEIKKEVIAMVEKAAHSVFFETGKATLKKSSYKSLNAIARVMKNDPALYVDIDGYTDNVGNPASNVTLSDKRANACRDYLISQGVSSDRITAKGFGEDDPVASNKTALGRAQNRRTEFKLRNYNK